MSPSESSNLRHRHISLPLWGGAPDAIRYPGIGGGDVAAGVGFGQQAFVGVEVGGGGADWCALPAALTDGLGGKRRDLTQYCLFNVK